MVSIDQILFSDCERHLLVTFQTGVYENERFSNSVEFSVVEALKSAS
jgi:hypothetical protein